MNRVFGRWNFVIIMVFIAISGCKKEQEPIYTNLKPWIEYGSMTDIEGHTYKTIQIRSQTWMASNSGRDRAVTRSAFYNSGSIHKSFFLKKNGLSVRCVRD